MFKTNQDSEISKQKFGVGSTVTGGQQSWLVIGSTDSSGKRVGLVNLDTFEFVGWSRGFVSDLNFLTQQEARMLVDSTVGNKYQWTFTDFDLVSEGLKNDITR